MKQLLLLLITLTLFGNVKGQKIEFSASLNSGLFSFRGNDATKNTFIYNGSYPYSDHGIIGNSSGRRNGLSYGASFNFKKVYRQKYFWGVDLGYEVLRSKASITNALVYRHSAIEPFNVDSTFSINISGKAFSINSFININPFIGYRVICRKTTFDLIVGVDLGAFIDLSQSGSATKPDGTAYDIKYYHMYRNLNLDCRPRVQLSSNYKKVGVYIGYSYGISNYYYQAVKSRPDLGEHYVRSELIRFGLTYKLK